jgi:membrane protease YdiL (CAAX protease family)
MNGADEGAGAVARARGLPVPFRLLVAFLLAVLVLMLDPPLAAAWAGAVVIAFALLQPPPVALRPFAPLGVLGRYAPFAVPWLGFTVLYLYVAFWCGHAVRPQPLLEQVAVQGLTAATWPGVIGAVVLAPVVEEILFRGYLLGSLLPVLRPVPAQLVTAAAFGAVHFGGYQLPIGVLGLLFGWLRVRYSALAPGMLAHALHNALTFAVALCWPHAIELMYPQ